MITINDFDGVFAVKDDRLHPDEDSRAMVSTPPPESIAPAPLHLLWL